MVKLYNSKIINDLLPNVKEKQKATKHEKPITMDIKEASSKKTFANEKEIFLYNKKMEQDTPENKVEPATSTTPLEKPEKVYKPSGRKPGQKDQVKRKSRYGGKMTEKQLEILAKARKKSLEVRKQRKLAAMEAKKATAPTPPPEILPTKPSRTQPIDIPPPRKRPSKNEIESNFFNLMDRYYQKRDTVKSARKQKVKEDEARKQSELNAEKENATKAAAARPRTSFFSRKKPDRNWDDFFY
jgi:hypothetical protein